MKLVLFCWACLFAVCLSLSSVELHFEGLPPIKTYPFESIGAVSRSARIGFDGFGRLTVVEEGTYAVLNDSVWLNFDGSEYQEEGFILCTALGADGRSYYGAFGDYGIVDYGVDGRVRGVSMAACSDEEWVKTAVFDEVLATSGGIYFRSWNGLAYYDFDSEKSYCFPTTTVTRLFRVGDLVFASSIEAEICRVDFETGSLLPLKGLIDRRIEYAAPLNDRESLLADSSGEFWVFDGEELMRWPLQEELGVSGKVSGVQRLLDGGVAIAISGEGIYLVDGDGKLSLALETPEYHRLYNMGANEPGVLWVVTERSVDKIQYGSPLTEFGQRLGLSLEWPQVEMLEDRLLVASDGKLYEAFGSGKGRASQFTLATSQLENGIRFLATGGGRVLVGDVEDVYTLLPNGAFERIAVVEGLLNMAMVGDDLCFAVGKNETVALGFREGKWIEVAARTEGLNYGPISHATNDSLWIEMGGDGVSRIWLEDGAIKRFTLRNEGWTTSRWVNVGVIDDIVVLSGEQGARRFFDEGIGDWCDLPKLDKLFDDYPKQIDRVAKGADGVIWATHTEGVVRFVPQSDGFVPDTYGLDMINDRYPRIRILRGGDIWIVAGRSLMRVRERQSLSDLEALKPVLVSFQVGIERVENIFPDNKSKPDEYVLPYSLNRVSFRLFSGGYGLRSVPAYEYRLSDQEPWTRVDSNSQLSFLNLGAGRYTLQIRRAGESRRNEFWRMVDFEILVPWYQTTVAYVSYLALFVGILLLGMKFSSHLVRMRNRELEHLVEDRTSQLRSTMDRLNEETRNSATLAERQRLAAEIHDSLQQGIIGAIIQLDATLETLSLQDGVRSRLKIVRNMVSYARQEVQHLVWDLDTTLHDSELSDVLKGLVSVMNTERSIVEYRESGREVRLPHGVRHNLLRIAQESTTNAIRHSGASKIWVEVSYSEREVCLCIGDNGSGFDSESVMNSGLGHFGLRGIQSRAKRLNANVKVVSEQGKGTLIRVTVPIVCEETNYERI